LPAPVSNLLLEKLAPHIQASIVAAAEPVALPIRTTIYVPSKAPKYIHFMTSGNRLRSRLYVLRGWNRNRPGRP